MVDPFVFQTMIIRHPYHDGMELGWRSRVLDLEWRMLIHRSWLQRWSGPALEEYVRRMIGDTIVNLHRHAFNAREMAQALMPFWEQAIHRHMEDMERNWIRHTQTREQLLRPDDISFAFESREDPKAKKRAEKLLLKNLNDEQRASYAKDNSFRVKGKDGKCYEIKRARSFNVKCIDDGRKYCGQLVDTPIEDQMLAQKLLLEHEPEKFFKNANSSGGGWTIDRDALRRIQESLSTATQLRQQLMQAQLAAQFVRNGGI